MLLILSLAQDLTSSQKKKKKLKVWLRDYKPFRSEDICLLVSELSFILKKKKKTTENEISLLLLLFDSYNLQ